MKTGIAVVMLFMLLFCIYSTAQSKREELAQQSADAWLAEVDAGQYPNSWD